MRNGLFFIIIGVLMFAMCCGCVRRRMTVRTNPPGATVYLDGKEIGRTPFSTNFNYYGKREFKVVKQGYETQTKLLPVRAPWYEWVGIDFVSEVLVPGKLTDQKFFEFELRPQQETGGAEIVARAEELRRTAHTDGLPQTSVPVNNIPPFNDTQPISGASAVDTLPSAFAPVNNAGSVPVPVFVPPQ
ncbi:MAG: PEGA domain-containing protein [Planctomycetaceae bacterium]|jgi:hypothetical protein|nr:PEGA domain-containing protein [Planctomycetaceae bacterium]